MSTVTAWQKMLAGEVYNCLDPDLESIRQTTKRLMQRHNQSPSPGERRSILEELLGHIGETSTIEPPFYCTYGRNTHLGDHVYLNYSCTILDNNQVSIGDHVMVGPAVQIYTAAHLLEATLRNQGLEVAKPITVENDVWIGGGAILLPGVVVGRGSVVGAGKIRIAARVQAIHNTVIVCVGRWHFGPIDIHHAVAIRGQESRVG